MTYLKHDAERRWTNYHRTIVNDRLDGWSFDPAATGADIAYFRDSALEIGALMERAHRDGTGLRPVGGAWSFSAILRGGRTLIESRSEDRIHSVAPDEKGDGAGPEPLLLVAAGTPLRNLNRTIEPRLSLKTSGAHDGQTVGGMLGTGTHGSVVGYGAFQNQVRGVHMVVGPQQSVWIERGSRNVLSPEFAGQFATSIALDPDLFDAAVVHLGGLGVLSAVLLEVSDGYTLDIVRRKACLGLAHLRLLEQGRFRDFAEEIWPATAVDPYYVEVTLNPFHRFGEAATGSDINALVTIYFRIPRVAGAGGHYPPAHDVLNLIEAIAPPAEFVSVGEWVFKAVADKFEETETPVRCTWGQAHGEHKKQKIGPIQIELFNAAYALARSDLTAALPIMQAAFTHVSLSPAVFTLRFVGASAGHLAFTGFADNVVVNVDGIRDSLLQLCAGSAANVALALETASVGFRQHWGKQGEITPGRFVTCYGRPEDPSSKAGKWLEARHRLLSGPMRQVIRNADIVKWGLA